MSRSTWKQGRLSTVRLQAEYLQRMRKRTAGLWEQSATQQVSIVRPQTAGPRPSEASASGRGSVRAQPGAARPSSASVRGSLVQGRRGSVAAREGATRKGSEAGSQSEEARQSAKLVQIGADAALRSAALASHVSSARRARECGGDCTRCAGRGHTWRDTDGLSGPDYTIKAIRLPNGTEIPGRRLQELSRTKRGMAVLQATIEKVCGVVTGAIECREPLSHVVTCHVLDQAAPKVIRRRCSDALARPCTRRGARLRCHEPKVCERGLQGFATPGHVATKSMAAWRSSTAKVLTSVATKQDAPKNSKSAAHVKLNAPQQRKAQLKQRPFKLTSGANDAWNPRVELFEQDCSHPPERCRALSDRC